VGGVASSYKKPFRESNSPSFGGKWGRGGELFRGEPFLRFLRRDKKDHIYEGEGEKEKGCLKMEAVICCGAKRRGMGRYTWGSCKKNKQ